MKMVIRRVRFCSVAAIVLVVGTAQAQTDVPGADELKAACPGLAGQAVPPSAIGLPSGPAAIVSATFVPAAPQSVSDGKTVLATPDYCKVLGAIAPVDPAAQPINFQVNLPIAWNGKALQYGGGGYNGTLITGLAPLRDAAPGDPLPLTRGYATLGTDSGHQASAFAPDRIGAFGLNDEMLINYGYASYKKVRDVAVTVMRSFYRRGPSRLYYFGGSEGGREGLTMAQRFPADYDGVVSVVPVVQLSMLFQSYIPHQRPQLRSGWMGPDKVVTLARFVSDACDALDGLADGVVNNYLACPAHVDLQKLRCPDGADAGSHCLSDAQIETVSAVHSPYTLPFSVANGLATYPQWLYGNETTPDPRNATMTRWVTGTAAPTVAVDPSSAAQQWLYGANFVRFFVAKDPDFDPSRFDPKDFQSRLQQVSEIIDSSNPDLSAFFARGGKLIIRENLGDLAQSPLAGINYFSAVIAKLGHETVETSARLYVSPASTHTGPAVSVTDGTPVPTMVDLLDPLDRWVTAGEPPADALIQTVKTAVPPFDVLAARPMCRYPKYPRYVGGDKLSAASYVCAPSVP
ncbi:tannase/feruloyl esterase family alpha/beta hydrolase [Inquilinus limosus]|uniref:tannase/feruloyl esterase family alpha/beta hydrolase n=1 Tax=Inquilinus limosus TaxID=171674 RepID=UPI003F145421